MITCSFLGHETLCDSGLSLKITEAIKKMISSEDEIEFVFCRTGAFYAICLAAVLEAKHQFPRKKITLTLVKQPNPQKIEPFYTIYNSHFPDCVFDCVHILPEYTGRQFINHWKKVERDIIRRSDFLMHYSYIDLQDFQHELDLFASKQKKLSIIDVTDSKTAALISSNIHALPSDESAMLFKVESGMTCGDIAQAYDAPLSLIRMENRHIRRKLYNQVLEFQGSCEHSEQPAVCTVIISAAIDLSKLKRIINL